MYMYVCVYIDIISYYPAPISIIIAVLINSSWIVFYYYFIFYKECAYLGGYDRVHAHKDRNIQQFWLWLFLMKKTY